MTERKKRGRPKGTTINDSKHLDAVADLIIKNPSLKKTPAIARIVEKAFPQQNWEAANRRLLRKWNETEKERLATAKERLQEERNSQAASTTTSIHETLRRIKEPISALRRLEELDILVNPPIITALKRNQELMDKINSPALRALQRQQKIITGLEASLRFKI